MFGSIQKSSAGMNLIMQFEKFEMILLCHFFEKFKFEMIQLCHFFAFALLFHATIPCFHFQNIIVDGDLR